uniref:Uncharacterized protein n=1 Tax=Panagrellus redivivus TaxID=6233 RepID=A0A7E4ZQW5_PANRE
MLTNEGIRRVRGGREAGQISDGQMGQDSEFGASRKLVEGEAGFGGRRGGLGLAAKGLSEGFETFEHGRHF